MLPIKRFTPEIVASQLWKRRWLVLFPFVLVALVTSIVSRLLPDQYVSEALILIEPQQVPENYIKPTVTTSIQDRLQSITRQILSRSRLEALIQELDLYPDLRRHKLMEDVVEQMRQDITVKVERGTSFRVAYVSTNPVTAMKVAERLAQFFIDQNLRDRQGLAQGTSDFLASQLEDARRRLTDQEHKLEEYRRQHPGELPSQQQSNLTAITSIQMQMQALVDAAGRDRDRVRDLEREREELTSTVAPEADTGSSTSAQAKLDAARRMLTSLQQRYTPQHPDVIRMQREVKKLENEVASVPDSGLGTPMSQSEQARARRVSDLDWQIAQFNTRIKRREDEQKRLQDQQHQYQAKADAAPTRETELISLTRDYSTLQDLYASLLKKSEDSRMASELESRQIGEQFRMLDPARMPERPFSPPRALIAIAGAAGGLALGLLLAALAEYRDNSFAVDHEVVAVLALPVLAMIPEMLTLGERRRLRMRRLLASTVGLLALTVAAGAVIWFVLKA
jgi:polysaccharide chain length determinant protein (PEP-CTERM system associated)